MTKNQTARRPWVYWHAGAAALFVIAVALKLLGLPALAVVLVFMGLAATIVPAFDRRNFTQ